MLKPIARFVGGVITEMFGSVDFHIPMGTLTINTCTVTDNTAVARSTRMYLGAAGIYTELGTNTLNGTVFLGP